MVPANFPKYFPIDQVGDDLGILLPVAMLSRIDPTGSGWVGSCLTEADALRIFPISTEMMPV